MIGNLCKLFILPIRLCNLYIGLLNQIFITPICFYMISLLQVLNILSIHNQYVTDFVVGLLQLAYLFLQESFKPMCSRHRPYMSWLIWMYIYTKASHVPLNYLLFSHYRHFLIFSMHSSYRHHILNFQQENPIK